MSSRSQINASSHRLSRVPQRYSTSRAAKQESSESFAASFFANNPDVPIDTRPPIDKIDEIDTKLQSGPLDDNEKFNLLVQKKSLCFLAFGENSPESVSALTAIGAFYNQQKRPESAMRHLSKAQILAKTVDLEPEEAMNLAVEFAESNLAMKTSTKQENAKYRNAAMNALQPFLDVNADDKFLIYRRDLLIARATARSNHYDETKASYKKAKRSLQEANDGKKTQDTASIYSEMAEVAQKANQQDDSDKYYTKAYQTLTELHMYDSARIIENKCPHLNLQTSGRHSVNMDSLDDIDADEED